MMNRGLINALNRIVYDVRVQNVSYVRTAVQSTISDLMNDSDSILSILTDSYGAETVSDILARVNDALENDDLILLADIAESVCIPAIERVAVVTDEFIKGDYRIEGTSSGHLTIKSIAAGIYLHSNNDPVWESEQLAHDIYEPAYRGYIVWGLGLGYFALELGRLTDGSVPVMIYEEDSVLIDIATEYGCIVDAEKYNVRVIHDPLAVGFTQALAAHPEWGTMMHQPSVRKIRNTDVRNALTGFYEHIYEPVRGFSHRLRRNYYANVSLGIEYVDAIANSLKDREVVIVAAGPSLDDSLDFIRSVQQDRDNGAAKVIITVGTVLKKLLANDIRPDYCVILDPMPITYKQVDGVLDCGIPMILGISSYWKIGKDYQGDRYLAVTGGMTGIPEAYDHSKYTFDVGSSVITLAMDAAMQMGVRSIYLVGADMAYKNGMYRTSDTAFQIQRTEDELIPVEGVSGETVYTTATLNEFRDWIEKEIIKYPDIPVYNLSKTGAVIHGCLPLL